MRCCLVLALGALAACSATPPDWKLNAAQSMGQYQRYYLTGDARAEAEFAFGRRELAATGREDIVARAELLRCALRTASLEFDDCPGFRALKAGAHPEDIAYAEFLEGRGLSSGGNEPLSRLVASAVQLRKGAISPSEIASAVDIASAEGWRRPLLAWLGVQEKRARDAGDADAAARIRRRIDLISG